MPKNERYKLKQCPTCGTAHKKKGIYCSRSCGNSRTFSLKQRQHLSTTSRQYAMTEAGAENATAAKDAVKVANIKAKYRDDPDAQQLTLDDFFLPPMQEEPIGNNQFRADGDLWTEVD